MSGVSEFFRSVNDRTRRVEGTAVRVSEIVCEWADERVCPDDPAAVRRVRRPPRRRAPVRAGPGARVARGRGGDRTQPPVRRRQEARGRGVRTSPIEVVPCAAHDLPRLFGLAKGDFARFPGWSDRRVLETLAWDAVFVARERDQPAGYVAL